MKKLDYMKIEMSIHNKYSLVYFMKKNHFGVKI